MRSRRVLGVGTAVRSGRVLAAVVALIAALSVGGGAAQAEHPEHPELGAFVGVPPSGSSLGVVVTTESVPAAALVATMRQAGCDPMSMSMVASGATRVFVPGAPRFVNARFPGTVPGGTQIVVRCAAAVVPSVDPENASYVIDGRTLTLADGRYDVPAAPGSAARDVTELGAHRSYGDLDGDGVADAAAALVQNPGGTGTFHYLAVEPGGSHRPAPTVFLGDRVIVDHVAIAHGRVTVAYLDRSFGDAMAFPPTVPIVRHFALEDGALVDVGSGACEAPALETVGSFVIVTSPPSGTEVLRRFAVTGCSRTFESNVNWRLLDREGAELASGFASGGGVEGLARFAFTVEYDVASRQVGRLEVFEVDASEGEGFPPPMEAITLILR